jgi:hypothetical protein
MIDIVNEATMPLSHAGRLLPPYRYGRPVSLSCVLRWVLDGVKLPDGRRVRLEAIRLGGRWLTSREALQRFAEAQTPNPDLSTQELPRTQTSRRRASDRAAKELDRIGI